MAVKTDNSSHAHVVITTCIVVPSISLLFLLLRIWTRIFISRSVGWDDCTAISTLIFCITYSILIGLAVETPNDKVTTYVKWTEIADFAYFLSLLGYKMAILLLYIRLFGVNKRFRYCTFVVMFFVFGYLCSNFFTQLFGCTPIHKYWNSTLPGHCIDFTKAGLAYGAMNISSDFFIFVLPLPMIWRLQSTINQKIAVSLIFLSGAIACTVAVVRYYYIVRQDAADSVYFIWTVIEINTGLMCSCTPAFRPFLKHVLPKFSSYRSARSARSTRSMRSCVLCLGWSSRHANTPRRHYNNESTVELGRYGSDATPKIAQDGRSPSRNTVGEEPRRQALPL